MVQTLEQWTETSAFLTWLRESPSIWAYPTVFFVHTLGLIFTAGASIVICARLLGAAPSLPVAPLARLFRPIWIAFWLTAVSGVVMLAADLEAKLGNRLFPPKMLLVAGAVAFMVVLRRRVEQSSTSASTRRLALASLACWIGAVAAGRFMAYFQ
jgi:hypothetical protein